MAVRSGVDLETCERCGLCVAVCPAHIPHQVPGAADQGVVELRAARLHTCLKCGHCMAICPIRSIHVDGLSYDEDLFDLPLRDVDSEAFWHLLASRRSIRVFRDTPLPRHLLQKIVGAISMAPMGFPPHKVEVTVVQHRDTIERALPRIVQTYEALTQWMARPFVRFMIRRRAGQEAFDTLKDHVLPSLTHRLPDMRAGQGDTITRGAPAMLLFHAHRDAQGRTADAWIALTHGLLAAHALGLGATATSLVPPTVDRSSELRALFEIPSEDQVLAAMGLGYPRHRFRRGIRRELARVRWL
jgi:nitroreductase/NAD-dependent dihydropyrimidine dehydrogenase PreA subunit